MSWEMVCFFMYLFMLKCRNLIFRYLVSWWVSLVLLMFVGLEKRKELMGCFLGFSLVCDSLIEVESDLMVEFWLKMICLSLFLRCVSVVLLFLEIDCCGILVIVEMIFFICGVLSVLRWLLFLCS